MKYKSKYTKRLVSKSSHLAELMCERRFLKQNITLPPQFWNDLRYKRIFMCELRSANSLLKLYPIEIILKALSTKDGLRIYSLNAKWLDGIILQEKEKEDNRLKIAKINEAVKNTLTPEEQVFENQQLDIWEKEYESLHSNHKGEVLLKKSQSIADKLKDL